MPPRKPRPRPKVGALRVPAPIKLGALSATVLTAREPRVTAAGTEWYWRVRRYESPSRSPQVAALWATVEGVSRRLVELLAGGAGEAAAPAEAAQAGPKKPTTVREALGFWKGHQADLCDKKLLAPHTLSSISTALSALARVIGDRPVSGVTPKIMEDLSTLLLATYARSSARMMMTKFLQAWRWCEAAELVPPVRLIMPTVRQRGEPEPRRVATWAEFWTVERATPMGWVWVMLVIQGLTGCRTMEAARVRWSDLRLSNDPDRPSTLRIGAHEDVGNDGGKHPRLLVLHPELVTRLKAWRDACHPMRLEMPICGVRPPTAKRWHTLIDWSAVGVEPFSGYALRRLMVRSIVDATTDPRAHRSLLGHDRAVGESTYLQRHEGRALRALLEGVQVIQSGDPVEPEPETPQDAD